MPVKNNNKHEIKILCVGQISIVVSYLIALQLCEWSPLHKLGGQLLIQFRNQALKLRLSIFKMLLELQNVFQVW